MRSPRGGGAAPDHPELRRRGARPHRGGRRAGRRRPALQGDYRRAAGDSATGWLLEPARGRGIRATFFVVGQIAEDDPGLVRDIHRAGHEVASHGWDHRRVLAMTPDEFREDVRRSKDALEQVDRRGGRRLPGADVQHRAARRPGRSTCWPSWASLYDSSIYPVRHDRYGVPARPAGPFLARGPSATSWSIPPATLRVARRQPADRRRRLLPPASLPLLTDGPAPGRARRRAPPVDDALLPPLGVRPGPAAPAAAAGSAASAPTSGSPGPPGASTPSWPSTVSPAPSTSSPGSRPFARRCRASTRAIEATADGREDGNEG